MPTTFHCRNCGLEKEANYRLKEQRYCNHKACQRARKRDHHKQRMAKDEQYRRDHLQSIADWRANTPAAEYQRTYRERHPDYVQKNREQQRWRNQKRRQGELTSWPGIVKGNSCSSLRPCTYLLTACHLNESGLIVKGNSLLVELSVFQRDAISYAECAT